MWWRPYKVIFDAETVLDIQKQIEAIPEEGASTVDFDEAFGENRRSAFLFPLLATHGEKGTILLERLLGQCRGRSELDNQWLLIVASLGRIPTARAEAVLEGELERVLKGELWKPRRRSAFGLTKLDARVALVDALLACKAGRGSLSTRGIEGLCAQVPDLTQLAWVLGLEWAWRLMPEHAVLEILERALAGCDDGDFANAMRLERRSDRLRAIEGFLLGPRDVWPLARKFMLREAVRRPGVSDYLRVLYCTLLVCEADGGNGAYTLDKETLGFVTNGDLGPCRALSYDCKVLLTCRPSAVFAQWDRFLSKHATALDPRDAGAAQDFVRRIHGPKRPEEQGVRDRHRGYEGVTAPGVHMYGFWGGLR